MPAIGVFLCWVWHLDVTQDDAYISFRYVANYLNGDGLVFNIGERVEGFTNFGWVILTLFWDKCGLDYILMAKVTGTLCGIGLIIITFVTAHHVFGPRRQWLSLLATYLLAVNMALGYWAPAGLETVAFALAVAASLLFYLKRSHLLIWTLTLAVWLRPEGALVAVFLVLIEVLLSRSLSWSLYSLRCAVVALLFSIPMVFFKILYYGSLLPNSYYAKTGGNLLGRISHGSDYLFRFMGHFGFWGAGLVLAWLFWRKLNQSCRTVLLFVTFYLIYIVIVGGDVLKVHRFFIPLLGLLAVVNAQAVWSLTRPLRSTVRSVSMILLSVLLIGTTIWLPWDFVHYYQRMEAGLLSKMRFMAKNIKSTDSTEFSVALTTIGVFSYELVGHRVIDMLGLTDSTIAKHPQPPIAEMETTWREGKYNCEHILANKPDYILFSTGVKPSAPAEMSLFLYPNFLNNYNVVGWARQAETGKRVITHPVYKKRSEPRPPFSPSYSIGWVKSYKRACELFSKRQYAQAVEYYKRALGEAGPACYPLLYFYIGSCYRPLEKLESSERYLQMALAGDSNILLAHSGLLDYSLAANRFEQAVLHVDWIKKLSPWYWPRVDSALFDRVGGYDNFLRNYVGSDGPISDTNLVDSIMIVPGKKSGAPRN